MTLPIKYEPQENIDEIPVNGEPDGDDVGSGNETDSDDDHDPAEVTRQLTKFRCLDAPATVNITVRDLLAKYMAGEIDLNPVYQRDVVWRAGRQAALIRSVLTNTHIPPLLFNRQQKDDVHGRLFDHWTCIDGKQRLSSLSAFRAGEQYTTWDDKTTVRCWYPARSLPRKGSNVVLIPDLVERFLAREMTCVIFDHLSPGQEQELFLTVQLGMPLAPAEKLKAIRGPLQDWIRLVEEIYDEDILQIMRNSRALGFRLIGTSMIQMDSLIRWRENNANDERVPAFMWSFGNLERWLKTPDHLSLLAKDTQMRVWRGWDTIRALDNRHGDIFARLEGPTAPRMSPIEMYGVFCLVTYWPGRRLARLAADIRSLRRDIRQAYKDLQSNNTVWKWIWNFIDYVIPINFGVAEDGSHERIPNPDEDEPAIQQARQYRLAKLTSLSLLGMSADQRIDVERTERERAGENIPVPPPSATDRGHRRTPASNSADRKRPASSPLERIAESSAVRKKSQRQSKPATLPGMPASAAQLSGIFDQAVAASSIHEPSKVQKRSRVTPPAASMQAASRSVPTPLHYLQSQDAELAVTPKNQARANRSSSSMKSSAGRRAMRPELVTPEAKAAARPNHDRQVPPPAPEPVGASTQRPTKRQPIFYNTFREARRNGPS